MARSLYLDPITGDLAFDNINNRLRIVEDDEIMIYTAQKIETQLSFFRGSWFLNRSLGIPYFQSILVKNPNLSIIASIFRSALLNIDVVVEILEFNVEFNTAIRNYSLEWTVQTTAGQITTGAFQI